MAAVEVKKLMKRKWSEEEDGKLRSYMEEHARDDYVPSWMNISRLAGLNIYRSGKSCRERWTKFLAPGIKRGKFSEQEDNTIIDLQARHGNKWALIAKSLPGRTNIQIKNYWNTHLMKKMNVPKLDFDLHTFWESVPTWPLPPLDDHGLQQQTLGVLPPDLPPTTHHHPAMDEHYSTAIANNYPIFPDANVNNNTGSVSALILVSDQRSNHFFTSGEQEYDGNYALFDQLAPVPCLINSAHPAAYHDQTTLPTTTNISSQLVVPCLIDNHHRYFDFDSTNPTHQTLPTASFGHDYLPHRVSNQAGDQYYQVSPTYNYDQEIAVPSTSSTDFQTITGAGTLSCYTFPIMWNTLNAWPIMK